MRKHHLLRVFLGPIASVVFLSLLAVGLGGSPAAAEFFAYMLAASSRWLSHRYHAGLVDPPQHHSHSHGEGVWHGNYPDRHCLYESLEDTVVRLRLRAR
jgi:hypothetical protein